uniref:Nuclear receptor domain-containing protein n=2 Tax=Panagrellus redivivus TaxID=6233 RepID=A0A7E4V4L6_PANRE
MSADHHRLGAGGGSLSLPAMQPPMFFVPASLNGIDGHTANAFLAAAAAQPSSSNALGYALARAVNGASSGSLNGTGSSPASVSAPTRGKKSIGNGNSDDNSQICAICSAPADGLHYNAISCRSCNAFFRRAVTFKQTYTCRKDGNCDVNQHVRCACRACRFNKCILAGMSPAAVQPRRDPTGSQKNRRPPKRRNGADGAMENARFPSEISEFLSSAKKGDDRATIDSGAEIAGFVKKNALILDDYPIVKEVVNWAIVQPDAWDKLKQFLKIHSNRASPQPSTSLIKQEPHSVDSVYNENTEPPESSSPSDAPPEIPTQPSSVKAMRTDGSFDMESLSNDDGEEFDRLIVAYHEHLKHMNLATLSVEQFLKQETDATGFRKMVPTDVEKLSTVELSGLFYWLDKQHPYRLLDQTDREALMKRYSVRKLSLDHFYVASKHKSMLAQGNFTMLNNTYVPPDETGFEGITDDQRTRKAKFEIFRPTLDRLWATIVLPFAQMNITDAEIVTLHMLLLWSAQNNRFVSDRVKDIAKKRRDWVINRLFEHYEQIGVADPALRLGEVIMLLPEIEVVCDLHCTDFHVAKLFQFCESLSTYWYEKWCYATTD